MVSEATRASFRANWAFFSRCSLLGCFLRMCVVAIIGHPTFLLVGQRRLMSGGGVQHHCWKKRGGGYGGWAPRRQGTVKNICDQASICPSRYFHPVTPAPMYTLILIQARPVPLSALLPNITHTYRGEGGEIVWANKESIVQVSCFWCRTNVPQGALPGHQSPPGLRSPWCLRCRG